MKLLIPAILDLKVAHPGIKTVAYDPSVPIPETDIDATGLIVWGVSGDLLRDAATRLRQLEWVQLLSAGSDAALAAGFDESVIITSGRSLHDETVAEHALALALAAARRLHTLVRAQIGHRWAHELGGTEQVHHQSLSTLRNSHIAIWGYGSIGTTLAPMLTALGARVTGIATSERTDTHGVRVVTSEALAGLLPTVDVLIMILPASEQTEKILDADLISRLPAHAWVINVGRGATIDEPALIEALQTNAIGGAALDVTSEEPLPPASPLWGLENVILTPHAAGGRPLGANELITENLEAFLSGEQLRNTVSH